MRLRQVLRTSDTMVMGRPRVLRVPLALDANVRLRESPPSEGVMTTDGAARRDVRRAASAGFDSPATPTHSIFSGGPECPCPGSGSVYHRWFNEGRTQGHHDLMGPPQGTRLVLMSDDLMDVLAGRKDGLGVARGGHVVTWEWGEPDERGWYTPTFTEIKP